MALGLLRLHEARLVARTEFSALATELSLVTRSALSLRCHAFMQEVCGNTGSLPRARINKLKATSTVYPLYIYIFNCRVTRRGSVWR